MRVIRKIGFFSLLIVATFLVQNVDATLIDLIYLPDSSYAEEVGNWQGHRIYEEEGCNVLVEFTVYDTEFLDPVANPDESSLVNALQEELDLTGQYIYAYQIFQHQDEGYEDVETFRLLNADQTPLAQVLDDIGSYDSGDGGKPPASASSEGSWTWDWQGGLLSTGEHSWFLVFSSDSAPVVGNYDIEAFEEGGDIPVSPEPGTLALLGLGSAIAFMRRKKFV